MLSHYLIMILTRSLFSFVVYCVCVCVDMLYCFWEVFRIMAELELLI